MEIDQVKILLVEDNQIELQQLDSILMQNGFNSEKAYNGADALDLLRYEPYDLVITDLIMPQMDGFELIKEIKSFDKPPFIIVLTSIDDSKKIIEVMKMGVLDYMIKPINREEFLYKFKSCIDQISSNLESDFSKPSNKPVSKARMIEENIWKEQVRKRDQIRYMKSLFYNIKTNMGQGAGIGTLMSLLAMLLSSKQNNEGAYLVEAGIINLIRENYSVAKDFLDRLYFVADIDQNSYNLQNFSPGEVFDLLRESALELSDFIRLRKKKISLKKNLRTLGFIPIEPSLLKWAFQELIRNAIKYSENTSLCRIEAYTDDEHLYVNFLNIPKKMPEYQSQQSIRGIPLDFEKIVFEPFFRISNVPSDEFESQEMGIGLSAVKQIARLHKGNIFAYNSVLPGEDTPSLWVKVVLELPLLKQGG